MNIIYEGVDISNSVELRKADITDNAGGAADGVDLSFADTVGLWSKWKPLRGNRINLMEGGYSSGTMYCDSIIQSRGNIRLKGLSLPPEAKTEKSKAWEAIRFMEMAREITKLYGFVLEAYNITDHLYDRIDQSGETDFDFLFRRCILEGYALKICDNKVVIYNEQVYESRAAVKKILREQFDGDYEFKMISTGLYSACAINTGMSAGSVTKEIKPLSAPAGPVLRPRVYAASLAEAERYCRGLLRAANKNERSGRIQIKFDPQLTAGCCVEIGEVGLADGKYFIEQAIHRLKDGKTVLKLRKPLEGY